MHNIQLKEKIILFLLPFLNFIVEDSTEEDCQALEKLHRTLQSCEFVKKHSYTRASIKAINHFEQEIINRYKTP